MKWCAYNLRAWFVVLVRDTATYDERIFIVFDVCNCAFVENEEETKLKWCCMLKWCAWNSLLQCCVCTSDSVSCYRTQFLFVCFLFNEKHFSNEERKKIMLDDLAFNRKYKFILNTEETFCFLCTECARRQWYKASHSFRESFSSYCVHSHRLGTYNFLVNRCLSIYGQR